MSNPSSRPFLVLFSLAAISTLVSCNAITGASDYRLKGDVEPEDTMVDAAGVSIKEIDIYQGIKRILMQGGSPSTAGGVPIIAARPALLRVFVETDATYDMKPVTGRLYINDSDEPIVVTQTLGTPPDDADLASTMNFTIPAEQMTVGMTYRIELKQDPGAPESMGGSKYPEKDPDPIEVQDDGQVMHVVLVPVQYASDGSNRLPDTSPEQLQAYHDIFLGMYPIPTVDVQVRSEPFVWQQSVGPLDENGWVTLLDAVTNLRKTDAAAPDVFYFAIFNPTDSEGQYCGQGCILGLANQTMGNQAFLRAAIGVGFTGITAVETAAHEVGHTFGRPHSPCGNPPPAGPDPSYPYPDGRANVWGYDLVGQKLHNPQTGDVMSYCNPYWISDYTYTKFFETFMLIKPAMREQFPAGSVGHVYNQARILPDGQLVWRTPVELDEPPQGFETKTIIVATEKGLETITGQYFPTDHLDGGLLVWPESAAPITSIKVDYKGKTLTLAR